MKRITLFSVVALAVFPLFAFTYKNVEIPKSECQFTKGVVKNISAGGLEDVVFELDGKQHSFYINCGIENGFDIHTLEKQLLAEEVSIYYADAWTPFAPFGNKSKHIREIRSGNWIIYSEF